MTLEAPTVALIAASATLAVVVLVLAGLLIRRSGRAADARLTAAVADMEGRMEAMVRELSAALQRAEYESRRGRALGGLAATIDLDEVLEGVVAAALEFTNADAALLEVPRAGLPGRPAVIGIGLSETEVAAGVPAGPPDGRVARAVALEYRYAEEDWADGSLLRAGLAVPLAVEDEPLGTLAVFLRGATSFGREALDELEGFARRAAPAIENAVRFREARRLADIDALTGLHNRRYFHEMLAREVARAQRYERALSLIVLDLDGLKAVNDRIGHLAGDAVLAEVAERMRGVVRAADVACRVGGDEFAVILPESALFDAEQLCRRIQLAVSAQPLGHGGTLTISAGVAQLAEAEDPQAFFQRTDDALYRAKESGRGGLVEAAASGSRATGIP